MKLLTPSALALCLLVFVGCAEGNAPSPETDTVIANATNKVEGNIEGMDCTGCSGSVMAAVEAIEGVTACHADVATGDLEIALKDDADSDAKLKEIKAVLTALEDGKYTVKTINVSITEVEEGTKGDAEPTEESATEEPAAAAPAVDEQASEVAETTFVMTAYKVKGMDCSGCSGEIVKAVEAVEGVQEVKADHMTGTVKVAFADEAKADEAKADEVKDVIAGLSDGKYTVSQ